MLKIILTYNDNGQLIRSQKSTGEVTTYEWNDQGMLKKVILPTGEPVEYYYDGNQTLCVNIDETVPSPEFSV